MWSPDQYERFKRERRQPFDDLVELLDARAPATVLDLGCGTGELTAELAAATNASETVGIDASPEMLRQAARHAGPRLRFEQARIESFLPAGPFDLVFSNAALHWVPDHVALFTRLAQSVTATGQLAIQMPDNDSHPSHSVAAETARSFGIAERAANVLPVERYASLLHRLGFQRQSVRLQVYGHLLPSSADVIEWVRGALLTTYEQQLGARYGEFLETYRTALLARIGDTAPYFYTYRRVLIHAARG